MHFIIHQSTVSSKFIILIVSCFCIVSAGCASTADSAPSPVEIETFESPTPTTSPSGTPTRASKSDVIAIPSSTSTLQPTAESAVSDSLNLATSTPIPPTAASSPAPRPTPTQKPDTSQPTSSPSPVPTTADPSDPLNRLARDMVEAVNAARQVEGLPPYQLDEELTALAQQHAQDMAERGYRSHTTPEGKSYADRLVEAGISPRWRGENFVLTTRPVDEAVQDALDWWMDDPPHRHNVLHPQHTHVGVGVAQTPEGWYIFVMDLVKR